MRLAFSTNAYLRYPFDEAAARIAALGYQGLELLADVPHAWPAGLLDVQKRAIRQAMERDRTGVLEHQRVHDERGQRPPPAVLVSVVHRARRALPPGPDRSHPAGPEPLRRAGCAPHHDRAGRPARAGPVAAARRSTCSSRSSSPWPSTPHDLGVLLLIEPEPGLLLETTDQYLEVAERLNAPSIGLNFDVGHAFCVSEDLPRSDRQARARTSAIITSRTSRPAGSTTTWCPAPAPSTSPRSSRRSARTGYDGWLTVELYPFLDDPDAAAAHGAGRLCVRS